MAHKSACDLFIILNGPHRGPLGDTTGLNGPFRACEFDETIILDDSIVLLVPLLRYYPALRLRLIRIRLWMLKACPRVEDR